MFGTRIIGPRRFFIDPRTRLPLYCETSAEAAALCENQLLTQITSTFDVTAPCFDQYRALPRGVPEAIRAAVFGNAAPQPMRGLDLCAGTGRLAKPFLEPNDSYIPLHSPSPTLRAFQPP